MIHDLMNAHKFLTYAVGGLLLLLSGYGQARFFPDSPIGACSSWTIAVLWLAFGLSTISYLGSAAPVLSVVVLISGLVWIARYYLRHRPH